MAVFITPPSNFIQGVGPGIDDYWKAETETPELMDPEKFKPASDQEQYMKDLVDCLTRVWDYECSINSERFEKIASAWEVINRTWNAPSDPDQSDVRQPEALIALKQGVGILMAMFEQSPDWWEIKSKQPSKQAYLNLLKEFVEDHLFTPNSNWWDIVEEGLESLLATGHVTTMVVSQMGETPQYGQGNDDTDEEVGDTPFSLFKATPGESKPIVANPNLPRLVFRNIPSELCLKDSSGENLYHTWELDLPVSMVFMNAEKMGWDKEALIRANQRKMDGGSNHMVTLMRKNSALSLDGKQNNTMRLQFFEGTLVDMATGAALFTNQYVVMANRSEIVYGPADIPWWDGERTIVDAPCITVAHEIYGRGLISENVDSFYMSSTMVNQMLDYLNEAFSGAYEYDRDMLATEAQRANLKIYPRACIPVEGEGGKQVIRRIQTTEVGNSAWQVVQALEMRKAQQLAMSDVGASPRPRGRSTAKEQFAREAQANGFWKLIFRRLERAWLSPMLRLSTLRLLQDYPMDLWTKYVQGKKQQLLEMDQSLSPESKAAWAAAYDTMASWDNVSRYTELGSEYTIEVKVFTSVLERQANLEKAATLVRQLAPIGGLQEVNMRELIKEFAVSLGYDVEKILNKAGQQPPSAGVVSPTNPDAEEEEVPDFTGMSGLEGLRNPGKFGGVFPGGPKDAVPNPPTPPPGL